jgi:glutathione synthase/RimK-type ligase-like ATP-grasp enzyme
MTTRFVRVRSKNFTADDLRRSIEVEGKAIVRLGSVTPTDQIFRRNPRNVTEINTVEAVNNSRNKLAMKECFAGREIPQATFSVINGEIIEHAEFPLVVKRVCGFQGRGMELINNREAWNTWLASHPNRDGWFVEKFYNYAREYRLHVARGEGIIMSWRKLRTSDATERWFFNSTNSSWVGPDHELFDRPSCWEAMQVAAINALESTGLDIGAVDIRVQSSHKRKPKFIVCEINSAPALGEMGIGIYRNTIKKLIATKRNESNNL